MNYNVNCVGVGAIKNIPITLKGLFNHHRGGAVMSTLSIELKAVTRISNT